MSDKHGLLVFQTESEGAFVEAVKKIDKFEASIEKQTKGSSTRAYTAEPGENWVPKITFRGQDSEPTYRSYLQRLRDGNGELAPEENWGESHYGPSWEEMQEAE